MDQFLELVRQLFSSFDYSAPVQTGSETFNLVVSMIQWAAIGVSALAGVYEARRRDLDYFGAMVIATVVSVGGGTVRDLLLGRTPLFWIVNPIYLVTVFLVSLVALIGIAPEDKTPKLVNPLISPVRHLIRYDGMPRWVVVLDALALGLWAYLGTFFALAVGASPLVAPVLGVITASFGGVIRDVFFAQVPSMFRRGQLYTICAALGSVVYVILALLGVSELVSFLACVAVTFVSRMVAVRFNITSG
jgi:uncharacterized membrane protein YeiH